MQKFKIFSKNFENMYRECPLMKDNVRDINEKLEVLQSSIATLDGMASRFDWIELLLLGKHPIHIGSNKSSQVWGTNKKMPY